MGFWSKVIDAIMGYDIISVDDAVNICTNAIKKCDADANGMLNMSEIISTIKESFKAYKG